MQEPTRLITVEEFAAMRQIDDWKEELREGHIHHTPPGSARHGIVCAQLAQALGNHCNKVGRGVVSLGSGLVVARNPDSAFAPDIGCWSADRPRDATDVWPSVPPVLVAEMLESVSEFHDTIGEDAGLLLFRR